MKLGKLDLDRWIGGRTAVTPPAFGTADEGPLSTGETERMRRPMIAGAVVILVCILGLGIWASVAPINSAVVAPGVIRVESNRQTLKSREGGIVRAIHVRDGDAVQANQVLMRFDDTVAKAQVEVLTNQYDSLLMQQARFAAEVNRQRTLVVPPALSARSGEANVADVIRNETLVFSSRLAAVEGQAAILNQRLEQLQSARGGLSIQVQSIDDQVALIRQELDGYKQLYEQGYASRNLILRYERELAGIAGRRGSLAADIQRNAQQAGETRLQLSQLYEQRATEAATGLRDAEARLADVGPRLDSARQTLAQTEIRAPTAGYVLNLTQFTVGGVAGSGEPLMDVVPSNTPLVVTARIRPADIDEVTAGMSAEVQLLAFNARRVPKLRAEVITVSADALSDPESGTTYFSADLRILPEELRRLPPGIGMTPGMQTTTMIQTGSRTIMSYLLSPVGEVMDSALREQ
ncbi:HlyD family type I secretion periplasmic adaptor subunit [Brevundimonas sp. R86498]|uniref:HlyD family type I secretion periplasmic adaptor subunit n=1 Tax=Brevundimonas sp. R86498 TaxID=3093845 RepID=UPI0037C859FD